MLILTVRAHLQGITCFISLKKRKKEKQSRLYLSLFVQSIILYPEIAASTDSVTVLCAHVVFKNVKRHKIKPGSWITVGMLANA